MSGSNGDAGMTKAVEAISGTGPATDATEAMRLETLRQPELGDVTPLTTEQRAGHALSLMTDLDHEIKTTMLRTGRAPSFAIDQAAFTGLDLEARANIPEHQSVLSRALGAVAHQIQSDVLRGTEWTSELTPAQKKWWGVGLTGDPAAMEANNAKIIRILDSALTEYGLDPISSLKTGGKSALAPFDWSSIGVTELGRGSIDHAMALTANHIGDSVSSLEKPPSYADSLRAADRFRAPLALEQANDLRTIRGQSGSAGGIILGALALGTIALNGWQRLRTDVNKIGDLRT